MSTTTPAFGEGYRLYTSKSELHKTLMTLLGLIDGIGADGVVTEAEARELESWCSVHKPMLSYHPFNELIPVINTALSDGVLTEDELLDIRWLCEQLMDDAKDGIYYDIITAGLQSLQGVLYGILADGVVTETEVSALLGWMQTNDYLTGTYPFDEVQSLVCAVLADGKITEDERRELKAFFSTFVDIRGSASLIQKDLDDLKSQYSVTGICAIAPEVSFEGQRFCLTGDFSSGNKPEEIEEIIKNRGGICTSKVSGLTNYLIVGGEGNPCWAYACYGRKIEKALMLRRDGGRIVIVSEADFWDALVE